LKRIPYLKSVWLKSSPIEGVYRTREKMEFLAGEKRVKLFIGNTVALT
jgi:hypothetical protein